ncbi:AGAP007257-PA-like protein [Anopheles sinensis]|uniref:AGAP007257-PA-like protein n=1 Tax=Anopheles sinensis TaxID=74873 RepID=A0A084VQV1_ANOSI|nr:AGAP007257-PA-like protein [Anopheles sinensis]
MTTTTKYWLHRTLNVKKIQNLALAVRRQPVRKNRARTPINTLAVLSPNPPCTLKKGSIPTVNPATHETKSNNGTGAVGAAGGGGSGSSNGAGSPIDEKLLSAVASIPNLSANLSLMVAAAVHAAQQSHQQQQQQLLQANSGLNATNLKRSAAAMSGSGGSGALQLTTASGTAPTTTTTPSSGSSSAKRNRAVPPLATPTGALANLIQRHQQIKEQQIKEQQRKAALGGSGLVNGQVSITSVPGARSSPTNSSAASRGGPISLVTSKKSAAANNNNNNVSHHNHNHKANHEQKHDQSDYGLNMNDTDMTGGGKCSSGLGTSFSRW